MSSLAIPSAVSAALPALNVKPHGHGHKKGSEVDPFSDSTSSSTAAQVPAGSAQGLFGNAFNALEQLVGVQPPSAATLAAAPTSLTAPTNSTAASVAAAGSKINLFA
jgi:hypothetical protein